MLIEPGFLYNDGISGGSVQNTIRFNMITHRIIQMSVRCTLSSLLLLLMTCPCIVQSFSSQPPPVGQPKTRVSAESSSSLRTLYPPISPFNNGTLQVDSIHTLCYEEYGNPDGIPALFLHGGPGAGCFPRHAQFFDPALYRIVLLDQRGSGASTPRGEVKNNTLLHLVNDCETLRTELGDVDRWGVVLGGSWGSTLALAYAQEHSSKVQSLVLRGVCLLRSMEIDWLFGGTSELALQPAWRDFEKAVGVGMDDDGESGTLDGEAAASRRRQALHGHYDRLLSNDTAIRLGGARSWMQWEMQVSASFNTNKKKPSDKNESTPASEKEDDTVVLVGRPKGDGKRVWGFRNTEGELSPAIFPLPPSKYKEGLRKQMLPSVSIPLSEQYGMRPIQPVTIEPPVETTPNGTSSASVTTVRNNATSAENATNIPKQWANYVPAQAMLTCFYSVNDRYAMNNLNLIDHMDRIADIPCIAIQGGLDGICPVNTALDVAKAYPNMELRIPLKSGHSMYDPAITNELVRATDRLAATTLKRDKT